MPAWRRRAGSWRALIRLLVGASPRRLLAFILIFVGVLSSVASDAGYLILVPLGAAAFLSVGRHPLAGMAACFAGVGAIFGVNPILGPIDAMITEITNEALGAAGATPLTIVANWFFSIASSVVLAIVAAVVTERIVEPRLGTYQPEAVGGPDGISIEDDADDVARPGRREAGPALRAVRLPRVPRPGPRVHGPGGRPAARPGDRRHHRDDAVHGQPAVHHRHVLPRRGHRRSAWARARSRAANDVIAAVTKTFAGLAGLVFMLLMISQFIAYFNYSNLPERAGDRPRRVARRAAGIGALPLLIGMIVIILLLDIIIPGRHPQVGDLRADLRPAVRAAGDPAADRVWRPIGSATRRSTSSRH